LGAVPDAGAVPDRGEAVPDGGEGGGHYRWEGCTRWEELYHMRGVPYVPGGGGEAVPCARHCTR